MWYTISEPREKNQKSRIEERMVRSNEKVISAFRFTSVKLQNEKGNGKEKYLPRRCNV